MLKILAAHHSVLNEPAQPHQQQSIIGGKSVEYFEFGIAGYSMMIVCGWSWFVGVASPLGESQPSIVD